MSAAQLSFKYLAAIYTNMLTLVIYDITDDKARTNLSTLLLSMGLERVQYSAFKGEMNPNDREVLARRVKRYVRDENDCVFVIPLCERCVSTATTVSSKKVSLLKDSSVDIV